MKNLKLLTKIHTLLLFSFVNVVMFAQEKAADLKVDVDLDKGGDSGMMSNPLYWVIGAVVLIIIIALITRGGGNKS